MKQWHRGWHISKSFFGYWFQHPGFDPENASDWRHGYANSVEEAWQEIDRLLEEDAEWSEASHAVRAMQIRAVTAEMRRLMPHACGEWADRIDAALTQRSAA